MATYPSKLHYEVDVALIFEIGAHSDDVFVFDDLHDRDFVPELVNHLKVADLSFGNHLDSVRVACDVVDHLVNFSEGACELKSQTRANYPVREPTPA